MSTHIETGPITLVPMTPDGSVVWQQRSIKQLGAILYTAPDAPADAVDRLLGVSAESPAPRSLPLLGRGSTAKVYKYGNAAIKRYEWIQYVLEDIGGTSDQIAGLSYVRANMALGLGLSQAEELRVEGERQLFKYRVPKYLACLALGPDHTFDSKVRPAILMSYESGSVGSTILPHRLFRRNYFERALAIADLPFDTVNLNDHETNNIVARVGSDIIDCVKLGVTAKKQIEF